MRDVQGKEASVLGTRSSVLRSLLVMLVVLASWLVLASVKIASGKTTAPHAKPVDGLGEWQRVYSVLTYPRCINCHTATNYPQQGDDRHRHFANVIRGPQDKGVVALNCATCHQSRNANSTGV